MYCLFKGVVAGSISGFIFSMWLCMGGYSMKTWVTDMLPLLDANCTDVNVTRSMAVNVTDISSDVSVMGLGEDSADERRYSYYSLGVITLSVQVH